MSDDEKVDDERDATSEALAQLTDDELEELTIASANPGLDERYDELLAERDRRRWASDPGS
jgi:hypothetical protein